MDQRVVFIILNSAIKSRIICDLTEKCYLNKQKTILYFADREECKQMDTLLWTWKQQSFIPHICVESVSSSYLDPVLLTTNLDQKGTYDTLLLGHPLPVDMVRSFSLIIDFAEKYDDHALLESRKRYKLYREEGFILETMQPGEFLHTVHP